MRIVLIGIGNIGRRWLESIMTEREKDWDIICVEPREEVATSLKHEYGLSLEVYPEIDNLPEELDLCAILTASDVRRIVFDRLVKDRKIKYLFFEKVLFQTEKDYFHVSEVLKEKGIKAWVNCTRRQYDSYNQLKTKLSEAEYFSFSYEGNRWGLGCNGIHILDLIAFLSSSDQLIINFDQLSGPVVESKRSGFKEFYGTIDGKCGKCCSYQITCNDYEYNMHSVIYINSDVGTFLVDETAKTIIFMDETTNWEWSIKPFNLCYTSQIMGKIVKQVLNEGDCLLPSFSESMSIHLSFIRGINDFLKTEIGWDSDLCPIT